MGQLVAKFRKVQLFLCCRAEEVLVEVQVYYREG